MMVVPAGTANFAQGAGFLKLRLGALPDADAAPQAAIGVMREGDFAPGLPFGLVVRAQVALEAG